LETFYYYQYGTSSTSYGGNAPSIQGVNAGSGLEAVPAPIGISGLVPATTYHYRLLATNAEGTIPSPDETFTTAPSTPPTVSTGGASNVTLTTATVAGTINPEGLETSYELDLGSDTTYGTSIYGEAGSASTPTEVTVSLQNLAPNSTYHYLMVAINSDGRAHGSDRTFTTPAYNNPIVQPPSLPLLQTPTITFPTETTNTGTGPAKPLTNKQKLKAALRACHHKRHHGKRQACERAARKR
jgi:phosphodiesterase/alkaline phosphatase D-like protein